jgi:hypothetical protein
MLSPDLVSTTILATPEGVSFKTVATGSNSTPDLPDVYRWVEMEEETRKEKMYE